MDVGEIFEHVGDKATDFLWNKYNIQIASCDVDDKRGYKTVRRADRTLTSRFLIPKFDEVSLFGITTQTAVGELRASLGVVCAGILYTARKDGTDSLKDYAIVRKGQVYEINARDLHDLANNHTPYRDISPQVVKEWLSSSKPLNHRFVDLECNKAKGPVIKKRTSQLIGGLETSLR